MKTHKEVLTQALGALEMVKANADDWQERTGKEIKGWMQPINNAITAIKGALAQPELCKYGQEPKSCTSSPMDCQCVIDAALAQPEQDENVCARCGGIVFDPVLPQK